MTHLTQLAPAALVLLPLLASAVSVTLRDVPRRILGCVVGVLVLALTVPVLVAVSGGTVVAMPLGGFAAPLGISVRVDGMSAAFLALTALVGAAVSVYAAAMPSSTGVALVSDGTRPAAWRASHPGFWPLWLGCWSGLNAVFVSGDLFNTYVGLELVGLTAVALVALGGPGSWAAALRYLFVAVIGSLLLLIGVAMVVSLTGTLDIPQSADALRALRKTDPASAEPALGLAIVLMTVGMALKVALVPMHRWLIPAHAGAPGAVSPLMSALVVKAALFVVLRIWLDLLGRPTPPLVGLGWMLGVLGAAALLVGSVLALRQSRLKPLIAYSTVAQVGYWFLLFPVLVAPDTENLIDQPAIAPETAEVVAGAVAATVILALGHGLAKASLFLAAGFLKDAYGTDEIARLRGVGRHHPALVLSMGLSAIGLVGLPLSLSFAGKWQLATTAVAAGHYWILAVLVVATLLSGAYMLKILAPLLIEAQDGLPGDAAPSPAPGDHPALARAIPLALAILVIATGFAGAWLNDLLAVGDLR
ncbi:complex I subunit 5 family protein [Microbacterium album]|uniref:complex I subunit 5 family protein n=1 Tax=Microbacterium album TaxID=2053191 RepID=UPI00166AED6C|nr:proton-conducting transporter membrane subunit [Microbacterium album]